MNVRGGIGKSAKICKFDLLNCIAMKRQAIINHTVAIINQLPPDKATEISDFADFVIKRYDEQLITENIQNLVSDAHVFNYLHYEEVLYTVTDLKERYND